MHYASAAAILCLSLSAAAQTGAKNGEWPTYGGDLGNTRYSALDQINAANFNQLQIAWRLKTENFGPGPEYKFEATPLMVKGVLYTTAGSRRAVVALDAATGGYCGCTRNTKGSAARKLRGNCLAAALPIGRTATKSAFSMSRRATG
jgi:glucose dehydrogenase